MSRIAVIGGGNWGTALAIMSGRAGHTVRIWSRNKEVVSGINDLHRNPLYLSGYDVPPSVTGVSDLRDAVKNIELVILAVPSNFLRKVLDGLDGALHPAAVIVGATKGIEVETGKRVSEIVADSLGGQAKHRFVCLSGPSFAQEVVVGHPTAIVAASDYRDASELVQSEMSFGNLRVYTNDDLVGTELAGALKNVMAIAAGMLAGLGLGSNSVAALITRGLSEMTRFALAKGARLETMMGLAGLGDLVLTCTGRLSRNRFVGEELGKGMSLHEIQSTMAEVAEGIKTTDAVFRMAKEARVEMPILRAVYSVLYEGAHPVDAIQNLMSRPLKGEF
jgi:glycerol-3-phosphate dehydrogenase (NAD(P)+)